MAETISEMLTPARRLESVVALFEYYSSEAIVDSHFKVTDETVTALSEATDLYRKVGMTGYATWLENALAPLTLAARYAVAAQFWRDAIEAIQSVLGSNHPDLAKALKPPRRDAFVAR